MTVGKPGECLGHPSVLIDARDLAVLDECVDHRLVIAAFVGAGEQGILAVERKGTDQALDSVVVEIDTAVVYASSGTLK